MDVSVGEAQALSDDHVAVVRRKARLAPLLGRPVLRRLASLLGRALLRRPGEEHMAGAGDEVDLHGHGAGVRFGEPFDGSGTDRRDVGDRVVHGARAEERKTQREGALGLGEVDEGLALSEAGGYATADGAGLDTNAGQNREAGAP